MGEIVNTDQLTAGEIAQIASEIDATPNADLRELVKDWRDRIDGGKKPSLVLEDTAVIRDDELAGAARVIRDLEAIIND